MAIELERARSKKSKLPPEWRWIVFVVGICALLSAVMRISIDSFAVFLLPLSAEFGWQRSEAVSIYGLAMLGFGFGCLLAGRTIDRLGPRWTYTAGLAMLAAVFLMAGAFDAHWQFALAVGLVVGASAALVGMVSHAMLLSHWFRENLTFVLSLNFAASGFGILIGAPILQAMIESGGWRAAYTNLGLGVGALAIVMPLLPWSRLASRDGKPVLRLKPAPKGQRLGVLRETVSDPSLLQLFFVQFLTAICLFSMNPQIVAFLVELGFDPVASALTFGAIGVMGATGVIVFGVFAVRKGRHLAMLVSYVMTIAGFGVLLCLLLDPSWFLIVLFVLLYGPAFGSRGPIVNAMVPALSGTGPGLGTRIGFVQLGMGLGAAVGATAGGWFRDIIGYEAVIILAMVSGIMAMALYWNIGSVRRL